MVFEGNPGFIFHDSRGFEAGGDRELKLAQDFIERRSKAKNVKEQLHAIWYVSPCISFRESTFDAEKKMFMVGIAFQRVMTDQSLQRKGSFSMNVGQDLVCVILSNMLP
jgi:hypothetical protein